MYLSGKYNYICTHTHICILYIHMHVCVHTHICICMYMCVCTHTFRLWKRNNKRRKNCNKLAKASISENKESVGGHRKLLHNAHLLISFDGDTRDSTIILAPMPPPLPEPGMMAPVRRSSGQECMAERAGEGQCWALTSDQRLTS